MNEKCLKLLNEKRAQKRAAFELERNQNLISWGFYDWEYFDTMQSGCYSYRKEDGTLGYRRKKACVVTDAEYKELLELFNTSETNESSDTPLESMLTAIGWICLIVGIFMIFVSIAKSDFVLLPIAITLSTNGLMLAIVGRAAKNIAKILYLQQKKDSK